LIPSLRQLGSQIAINPINPFTDCDFFLLQRAVQRSVHCAECRVRIGLLFADVCFACFGSLAAPVEPLLLLLLLLQLLLLLLLPLFLVALPRARSLLQLYRQDQARPGRIGHAQAAKGREGEARAKHGAREMLSLFHPRSQREGRTHLEGAVALLAKWAKTALYCSALLWAVLVRIDGGGAT
jgi:hypothetical protein